ncbi:unnamed protein product [Ixodes hexagonus]
MGSPLTAGRTPAPSLSVMTPVPGFLSPAAPTPAGNEDLATRSQSSEPTAQGVASPYDVAETFSPPTGLASPPSRPLVPASPSVEGKAAEEVARQPNWFLTTVAVATAACLLGVVVLLIKVLAQNAFDKKDPKMANGSAYSLEAAFVPL